MNLLTRLFLSKKKFFLSVLIFLFFVESGYFAFWYFTSEDGYFHVQDSHKCIMKLESELAELQTKKNDSLALLDAWENSFYKHEEIARTTLKYACPEEIIFYKNKD